MVAALRARRQYDDLWGDPTSDLCSPKARAEIQQWVESLPDQAVVAAACRGRPLSVIDPAKFPPVPDDLKPWEFPTRPLLEAIVREGRARTWLDVRNRVGKHSEPRLKTDRLVGDAWADRIALAFDFYPWEIWPDRWFNQPVTLEELAAEAGLSEAVLLKAYSLKQRRCRLPLCLKDIPSRLNNPTGRGAFYFSKEALDWARAFKELGVVITVDDLGPRVKR